MFMPGASDESLVPGEVTRGSLPRGVLEGGEGEGGRKDDFETWVL